MQSGWNRFRRGQRAPLTTEDRARTPGDGSQTAPMSIASTSSNSGVRPGQSTVWEARLDGRDLFRRYGIAIAANTIAVLTTLLLFHSVFSRNPFALFYAAVMVSAYYGGLGPGLLATLLAVWSLDYFFLPTFFRPTMRIPDLVQVCLFGSVALLISGLNANRKRALGERLALLNRAQAARSDSEIARAAAEEANRRSTFLAEASKLLSSSFEYEQTLAGLTQLSVPAFADGCTIDLVTEGGATLSRVAFHCNAGASSALQSFISSAPLSVDGALLGPTHVVRNRESQMVQVSPLALAGDDPFVSALRAHDVRSCLSMPLRSHDSVLGVITFLCAASNRQYGAADLMLADDLARRAAIAVAHARVYREAQDANRMKDEFLAVVSHELRTPLNAILGWAYLMKDELLDDESFDHALAAVERNAKAQARIIDDVLDVSRIIRGKLKLTLQPVHIDTILDAAIDAVKPAAESKGVSIRCETPADLATVSGDADRLQQAIWNLISNAVKFTPGGGQVQLRCRYRELDPGGEGCGPTGSCIEITVSDSGRGIAPEFLPHVFERFRQADASSTRQHGGLGLGLSIVRYLIELHGGTVNAYSEGEGKGATFTIRLPAMGAIAMGARTGTPTESVISGRVAKSAKDSAQSRPLDGIHVLVVDDEADARDLFESLLRREGAVVVSVGSTADAMQEMTRAWPDVLLSDIGMPGEDGYDLIRKVRSLESRRTRAGADAPALPAAALTAFAGGEDRRRALREGFQMHVPKPIAPKDLTATVAALAGRTSELVNITARAAV